MVENIFDRKSMTEAVNISFTPTKAVFNKLFNSIETFDTRFVDLDIKKGGRSVAPYIQRGDSAVGIASSGFSAKTYEPPLIKLFTPTNADELLQRGLGENVYDNKSPTDRAASKLLDDQLELDNMIQRAEEIQCVESLLTGIVTVKDDEANTIDTINYGRASELNITTDWTGATSNPIADIRAWQALAIKNSGIAPNIMFLGSESVTSFLNNDKVGEFLDNRRIDVGELSLKALELGVTLLGVINGVQVYSYDEFYTNPAGVVTPILDTKKMIFGSTFGKYGVLYGGLSNYREGNGVAEGQRLSFSTLNEDGDQRKVHVWSAPLAIPKFIDSSLGGTVTS